MRLWCRPPTSACHRSRRDVRGRRTRAGARPDCTDRARGRVARGLGGPAHHGARLRAEGGGRAARRQRHPRRAVGAGAPMTKGDNGVWEVTLGPVPPGAYRYAFVVDGVPVDRSAQPGHQRVQRQRLEPGLRAGLGCSTRRTVPHGAVAEVTYHSTSLGHVPPDARLHAAGLRDGRRQVPRPLPAARRRRQRRLVVHRRPRRLHPRQPDRREEGEADDRRDAGRAHAPPSAAGVVSADANDAFADDFLDRRRALRRDSTTACWRTARTAPSPACRWAAARRSTSPPRTPRSSATSACSARASSASSRARARRRRRAPWSKRVERLGEAQRRGARRRQDEEGAEAVWFATGKEDFLLETTRATVNLFKEYGYAPVYKESEGGHTWINWRDYLSEFAPLVFRSRRSRHVRGPSLGRPLLSYDQGAAEADVRVGIVGGRREAVAHADVLAFRVPRTAASRRRRVRASGSATSSSLSSYWLK